MALVFDDKNIKVDFFSKAFDKNVDKFNTKTILFPVLRYKIYAPCIEEFKLNIFQKTVLSILNKGNFEVQKISVWLKLDIQLVQILIVELSQKGLVNNGVITNVGREFIEGTFSWFKNVENIKKDIYYIYQDIYTKKLYPVLMKFDPSSDYYEYEDKKIQKNSKGNPLSIHANLIEPRGVLLNNIQKPEINEVFEAIQRQSNITSINNEGTPPNLIKYLDYEATLSYLATTIYIDSEIADIEEFKVLDPFGIEDIAYWLKDNLYEASKTNIYLKSLLESLVIDATEEKKGQLSDALKEIRKEAVDTLDNTFDYSLKMYDELYKSLEDFYMDLKLYESDNKNGKYLKEAFKNSQTVLETLFFYIYQNNKKGYQDVLQADNKLSNLFIEEVSKKIKTINPDADIPQWKLSGNKFTSHTIKQALNNPYKASLRALYIGALLATWYDRLNPMFYLINRKGNLLIFLEKVADGRNAVGHKYKEIPDAKIGNYYDEVLDVKTGIEEIVAIFLEGK